MPKFEKKNIVVEGDQYLNEGGAYGGKVLFSQEEETKNEVVAKPEPKSEVMYGTVEPVKPVARPVETVVRNEAPKEMPMEKIIAKVTTRVQLGTNTFGLVAGKGLLIPKESVHELREMELIF